MGLFWSVCLVVLGTTLLGLGLRRFRSGGAGLCVIAGLLLWPGVSGLMARSGQARDAVIVGAGLLAGVFAVTALAANWRFVRRDATLLVASVAFLWATTLPAVAGSRWQLVFAGVFVVLQLGFISLLVRRLFVPMPRPAGNASTSSNGLESR